MSNPVAEGLAAHSKRDRDRTLFIFTVPQHLADSTAIEKLGLVELRAQEEMSAAKRAGTNPMRLGSESAKESLRMVNGSAVSSFDGSVDKAWEAMHPKVRNLVIMAYGTIHQPKQEEGAAFLASMTATVG